MRSFLTVDIHFLLAASVPLKFSRGQHQNFPMGDGPFIYLFIFNSFLLDHGN